MGNLNVQLATASPRKKHFLRACAMVFKMARSNNMRCKKWALIEFLVTENKSVTNRYKWFKNVCHVSAVDNNTDSRWNY